MEEVEVCKLLLLKLESRESRAEDRIGYVARRTVL